jgi:hypothetical protein
MELCLGIDLPRSEPEAELLPPETKTQLKENNPSRIQLLRVYSKNWPVIMGNPEIGRAMPVRGLIGGKEAIDHEAEVAPKHKTHHNQICPAPA